MTHAILPATLIALISMTVMGQVPGPAVLAKARYLDKCKGAWAGQMIGVCYGSPYEFRSNGKPITEPLRGWRPERVAEAIHQDDCYVEMTFLQTIEEHGLDVTFEQAGKAFANTKYPLWHANRYGRENCRHGVMPPMSGHPLYNHHADDIDFQIEADLFGILCPGMPRESNRLCEIFGRIMNYGDGLYGGMFVAGMYAEAYFEDNDIEKVVRAGLACIPEGSPYHECISDVLAWHREAPNDWLGTWEKIEAKWQDDVDCAPGNPFNIDAKLNGAYIVMGLLYGNGDFERTMEIATRCGQDADCNPSNAAGVLGCMKGYASIPTQFTEGMAAIAETRFSHTDYSFTTLIPTCQRVTEKLIERIGGTVSSDSYTLIRQAPAAPITFEQWTRQQDVLATGIPQYEVSWWNPDWRIVACGHDMEPGFRPDQYGRQRVLALHPIDRERPAVIATSFKIPVNGSPALLIETASDRRGDYVLRVVINGEPTLEKRIDTKGEWTTVKVDLMPYTGKEIDVRIENWADDWEYEAAYLGTVALAES